MTQKKANLILATVSMGWGTSYIFMKLLADTVSPMTMVSLRFGIAFIVMALLFSKRIFPIDRKTLKNSMITGLLLLGIFMFLSIGMKSTTASTAGFLTSTTVILVPVLQAIINRKWPSTKITLGVIIVSIGLSLLSLGDDFALSAGALYCLAGALFYAVHIIVTNRFIKVADPLKLGVYQLGFAAIYAAISGIFLFGNLTLPQAGMDWLAILGLALICSAYGFVMQPIAQKHTTPEMTGFLFALEPIFAAVFAFVFLQENIGLQGYVGALLVLCGVLTASMNTDKIGKAKRKQQVELKTKQPV
ncbi:DMT family transporter [Niallia sp. Man26]|uniref:DMT family transporter n=1 Tax=Niallia sp. Man26 TaxID=2912824 RepID=UPI001EDBEE92|nr:DMT family transporter [Niallia sp. Man26]UPO90196.1 DMT family transporter [Niallia sp. Man26]